jgi:hypothetical protein
MKRIALALLLIVAATSPLWADCYIQYICLFYSGDFDPNNPNANGLGNENDAVVKSATARPVGAATFQNFQRSNGPPILALFTNNLSRLSPTGAYWEIRSGMSEGDGGTLIASGTASGGNFVQTPTGRSGFGYTEYTDVALGLDIELPPGTYWFAVVPQATSQADRSFNSNTFGLNSIGTDIDNEQYFNSALFGAHFTNANNEGVFPRFSGGVLGNWCGDGESCSLSGPSDVPEPSSLVLLGAGVMGAAFVVRRRWFS